MKLLVFGNSHAACLIEAWREGGQHGAHRVEFFVRSGNGVEGHAFDGTRISAETAGMRDALARLGLPPAQDLAEFDALAIVASGISLFPTVQALNTYRILEWPPDRRPDAPAITESVLRLATAEALARSNAGRLLARLRQVPGLADIPVHLLPQPFPSERALSMPVAAGAGFKRLIRVNQAAAAAAIFRDEAARLAVRHRAIFHPQPPETVAHHCLTRADHSTGARRLINMDKRQPAADVLHANLAYGRILLRQLLGDPLQTPDRSTAF